MEDGARAGIDRDRLDRIVSQFQRLGVTPEQGREILQPALEAARSGLPSRTVLNRINEGLLKRVPPEAIAAASRKRLESLRSARRLLLSTWGPATFKQAKPFIASLGLALESGLPPQVVTDVLTRGRGKNPAEVKSVIEAGEALQVAGFDPEVLLALLRDCLDRDLHHADVLKVVRFAVERKRQGQDDRSIREALWGQRGAAPWPSAPPTRPPAREPPAASPPPPPETGPRAGGP
ncbi:MAG: hypothetical protein HY900_31380 [Deltaproteobacteria bacterium]|nr:hypothetical protein [Deltaproteobacteria bacterium]